ncbi:MAG: hypothetical protein RI580_00305 [Halothece sp. Uz-M2-17]|nr:hypothetical protein [Halothece sp. Uz-M2-17]
MNYSTFHVPLVITALVVITPTITVAQNETRTERIQFEPGASSAVVENSMTGYESVDYIIRASEGQYMNVSMATDNTSNYFNILAPGENEAAIFIGSTQGNQYEGILPASGDYKIRVYLMRSAARRDEMANYRLEMIITDSETLSSPDESAVSSDDATRAGGGEFDATGQIPCAQYMGQPMTVCDFGVSREGNGTATVVITKPDGQTRAIFFVDGQANSADTSQADGYGEFKAERESDLNFIRVGEERYEIPDAVIYGG